MHEAIAKQWIEALRSGKYRQGKQKLAYARNGEQFYCCLGVLCKILEMDHSPRRKLLTGAAMNAAGMRTNRGRFDYDFYSLADYNDGGSSFSEIADIIEANWQNL